MKKTPLYNVHVEAGAKIVDFAGFLMPVQYTSILKEHEAVRTKAGLFDVSHMGEFTVKGPGATKYLASMIPTDINKLEKQKGMYTCFCFESGGVIDDLFIFMINSESYYLVVNAGTLEKDFKWMEDHLIEGVEIKNVSDSTAKIDIQGPQSKNIMNELFSSPEFENIERFFFCFDSYKGDEVIISNTGYTGESGYEIFIEAGKAENLWKDLMKAGEKYGLQPAGLGARDTLRLECCYSLYGHEINEEINPVEAGLSWLISSKEDYIGKEFLTSLKEKGAARKQVCIEMTEKGIPRENYEVHSGDKKIGYLTSGAYSPTFKRGLGLGLVDKNSVNLGDEISIIIRNRPVKAKVVKRPFYSFNA